MQWRLAFIIKIIEENKFQLLWIIFGLLTLLLFKVTQYFPNFIEYFYSRGLFVALRFIWDHSISLSPLPLIYLFFPLIVFFILKSLYKYSNTKSNIFLKVTLLQKITKITLTVLAFVLGTMGLFYWSWGFNYNRVQLETQLALPVIIADEQVLLNEFNRTIQSINDLRKLISEDETTALNADFLSIGKIKRHFS